MPGRRTVALTLITLGVVTYFAAFIQNYSTGSSQQVIASIFAVGGLILLYLPHSKKK